MKKTIALLLAGAALSFASSVGAAALCSAPGAQPDGLNVADVTLNGTSATDCNGVFTGVATAGTLGFDGFSSVATATAGGAGSGTFGGETFTLSVSAADSMGTWSLAWAGITGPITIDLVAAVQTTATTFASYFFDDLVLGASPGSGTGDWAVNYLVNEDWPLLTSLSLYARDLRTETGGTPTPTPPPTNAVDEPGALALVAVAALALGLARRVPLRTRR